MKRIMALVLVVILATSMFTGFAFADTSCPVSVSEINLEKDEVLLEDIDFIKDATISVSSKTNDESEILLSKKTKLGDNLYSLDSALLVVDSDEATKVIADINGIKAEVNQSSANTRTLVTKPIVSDWFLGSTLYMEMQITYDYYTSGLRTFYKMTSVSAKATVQNGTTISKKALVLQGYGTDTDLTSATYNRTVDFTSYNGKYTTTVPNSWDYITPGMLLGANFQCNAARPSGSSTTYAINDHVFYF